MGSIGALLAPGAEPVRAAVADARHQNIPVSYDPNLRPTLLGDPAGQREPVEQLVTQADVVKASEDDLGWLYPGTPPLTIAARWARAGPWLVIVTRGARGATALSQEETLDCQAPPVAVVDTVGAGDAFTAGLLAALARRDDLAEALRFANATGAAVCQRRGAGPADPVAVEALLAATPPPRRQPRESNPTAGSAS
jgi:fructokinase